MRAARGFTVTEMILALSLFSTMLVTVLSLFNTAQQNYLTSIGVQQAQLRTAEAIDVMRDDLAGARIEGYLNEFNGRGKVFVKFRRLAAQATMASATMDPVWEAQARMYVWCGFFQDPPCNQFAQPPATNQLVLARADRGNAVPGNLNGPWAVERVIIGNMDTSLGNVNINDPATYPFQLGIFTPNDTIVCRSLQPDAACNHGCLAGVQDDECEYPFALPMTTPETPIDPSRLPSDVALRILTAGRIQGLRGDRIIREQDKRIFFHLRNKQRGTCATATGACL